MEVVGKDNNLNKINFFSQIRWWEQKRGGGKCKGSTAEGAVAELGLPNVAGVFIVTVLGCVFAT